MIKITKVGEKAYVEVDDPTLKSKLKLIYRYDYYMDGKWIDRHLRPFASDLAIGAADEVRVKVIGYLWKVPVWMLRWYSPTKLK